MTLLEQFDGFFLSCAAGLGTPSMCVALPESRNDFSWAPLTPKVVGPGSPLNEEPRPTLL